MFDIILKFLNDNLGFVTLIAATSAFLIYWKQKEDQKRNAARIILQEIRRAEDIIFSYPETKQFRFTRKIIATNSWATNIHHFVYDLDQDELDKISDLYSTGEYLDEIISKVSDYQFSKMTQDLENKLEQQKGILNSLAKMSLGQEAQMSVPITTGGQVSSGQQFVPLQVQFQVDTPWSKLFDDIVGKYEPIYHSTIVEKLKKIAKLK